MSATGLPVCGQCPGTYVVNGEEEEGTAVYRKSDGRYLYRHRSGTWRVGWELGDLGDIRSLPGDTAECPASISQWQYNAGVSWHNGDITVKCAQKVQTMELTVIECRDSNNQKIECDDETKR